MRAALAIKPMAELINQYGPLRTVLQSHGTTDVLPELHESYAFVVDGGKPLRLSRVNRASGGPDLVIQLVEYSDPVTRTERFAVEYWTPARRVVSDHEHRVLPEMAYEKAVRDEFAYMALRLPQRLPGGLTDFYDVTDVR